MIEQYETYHPAARATPALVGRKTILEQVRSAIERRKDTVVVYIPGAGGTGKTRLLTEVLRLCNKGDWRTESGPVIATKEPVDLYHTQTHSLEGLVRAMGREVGPDIVERFFKAYTDELEALEQRKPDLRFALSEIAERRDHMTRAFIAGFQQMAQSARVVMAFDTAEMLLYETDAVQRTLRLGAEGVGARRWLIEQLLPQVPNTVFLIAGRPRPQLLTDLQESMQGHVQVIELGAFSEDETPAYFDQVAIAARTNKEEDVAQRIENVSAESRQVIHLLAGGQPILLSLVMDLLALAKQLPDEVKIPLTKAKALKSDELRAIQDKLESSIVSQFQEDGSPKDEAIRSLAFARKGMDPVLLARVADMEIEEAKQVLSDLTGLDFNSEGTWPEAIPGVRPLSFIKVRPADRRVFLHDEMYALMGRHVLRRLPEADVKRTQRAIQEYHDEELQATWAEIERLQPTVREEITPERQIISVPRLTMPPELLEKRAKAGIYEDYLMSEEVHYLLHFEPLRGFQTYCRYSEHAFEANDENLDMQLRDELLVFVESPDHKGQNAIDGLRRAEVDLDAGIRWIRRNILRNQYDQAVEVARRLREECADLVAQGGEIGAARLDVWEGIALAYQGLNPDQAEKLLERGTDSLRRLLYEDRFRQWQRTLELANAYNGLGYILVRRGRHRRAIDAYMHALPLWRGLGKEYRAEHANTLNNMSWVMAEFGDFEDAIRRCMDGLDLRLQETARYPAALSYNTLGQIQTRNDQPHRARSNCEHALAILRELEMDRGIGMASIALAEASRRMGATVEVYFPEEQVKLMRQAIQHAREAVAIFGPYTSWPESKRDKSLVAEPARLVDALIELGCAYRDWARLYPNCTPQPDDPSRTELAGLGELALREAAEAAGARQPHRAVDALVNLAWLKYYVGDLEGVESVLNEVQRMVKSEYLISQATGLPSGEPDQPWHWVQLGKVYLLKGHIAFNRYYQTYAEYKKIKAQGETDIQGLLGKAQDALRESAVMYTLSLAYNDLYGHGQMFRDLKRGEARIYDRFRGLNIEELRIVRKAIQATAETFHLPVQTRLATLMDKWFLAEESNQNGQYDSSQLATMQI